MHFTAPLLTLLSVLPLLASATPDAQPAGGLVIKQVDLSLRKRQAATTTGGSYVTSWNQCTQVCEGYFGKPSSSVPAANNAVVATSTTRASSVAAASSVRPSTTAAAVTTRVSSSSRASTSTTSTRPTSVASTTRASSAAVPTSSIRPTTSTPVAAASTSTRASSAAISSARATSAAPPTTSASGGSTTAAQRQVILDLHNAERRDYGASALTWNTDLEKYAFDYGSKCLWKHSQGPYGENLAASYGYPDAISQGINGWNAERSQYNPAAPMYSHWTAVVWKGTSQVGCAMVKCPPGSIQPGWAETDYLVCEYKSPGNVAGQYATNVGPRVA